MLIVRLSRQGNSFGVVVPRPVMRRLQWVPGDILELVVKDGRLVLQLLKSTATGRQLFKLHEKFQAGNDGPE